MTEKCDKCDREFDSERGLNVHKAQKHKKETENDSPSVEEVVDENQDNTVMLDASPNKIELDIKQTALVTGSMGLLIGLVFSIGLLTGLLVGTSMSGPVALDSGNFQDIGEGSESGGETGAAGAEGAEDSEIGELEEIPYDVEFGTGTENVEWDGETVELVDRPYMGSSDAPVTMVSYEDYFCPFCTGFHNSDFADENNMNSAFGDIAENHIETGEVQYYFKNFPVVGGDRPAEVSECFAEHGSSEDFWTFNHNHFQNFEELQEMQQTDPSSYDEVMYSWAEELDITGNGFESCIEDSEHSSTVHEDAQEGERLGASSTPTNFVEGEMIEGAVAYTSFEAVINDKIN